MLLRILLSFLVSLSVLSCASIDSSDIDILACVETSPMRGQCTMTVSDRDVVIDEDHKFEGKTWWEIRPALIHLPPSSWAKVKVFVIKICKKAVINCDEEIASWDRRIQVIDKAVEEKTEGSNLP